MSRVRLLVDGCIDKRIVDGLQGKHWADMKDVFELSMQSVDDKGLLDYATRDRRILVTKDRGFADVARFPVCTHAGIIYIAIGSMARAAQALKLLFASGYRQRLRHSLCRVRDEGAEIYSHDGAVFLTGPKLKLAKPISE